MRNKQIVDSTTNRGEFNRAYKEYLAHSRNGIGCSYCRYHKGENNANKWYGGFKGDDRHRITYPNWKLVSKNRKQWMKKPIKIVEEFRIQHKTTYVEIKFST